MRLAGVALAVHAENAIPQAQRAVSEIGLPIDPSDPVAERPGIVFGARLDAGGHVVAELDLVGKGGNWPCRERQAQTEQGEPPHRSTPT